ncbi:hypothetical protein MH117_00720 [Paenibacillus sp. ACRRX]|nr:hypothetical protein [Paenibacillus sp. ACRRX]
MDYIVDLQHTRYNDNIKVVKNTPLPYNSYPDTVVLSGWSHCTEAAFVVLPETTALKPLFLFCQRQLC